MIHEINGLNVLEEKLQKYLQIGKVIIVPGDTDSDPTVLREMGRIAANYIKGLIHDNSIISLTGGSSVSQIVDNFPKISKENILVVPARGGMGRDVETQANTLAAKLAIKIGANHKLLHVPDNLSHGALETIINEPDIKDTISKVAKSDILIFGIGRADDMAKQRGLSDIKLTEIEDKGAVAEAFGYYFNREGEIIYTTSTIGVNFSDVKYIKNIIAVAGGSNKAEAIVATKTHNDSMVLVTDEGAAKSILKIK
jgi:central glycolytic genes regulator